MNLLKHTLLTTALLISVVLTGPLLAHAPLVSAATQPGGELGEDFGRDYSDVDGTNCQEASWDALNTENCGILKFIVVMTNVLSAAAGVAIVASLIFGGIQYSAAGTEGAKVQAAKKRITDALLALLFLVFGFSFIQWLVPGGIF